MSEGGEEIVIEEKEKGESGDRGIGESKDGGVAEQNLEEEEDPGMEANHKELARDMFEKITDYLNGELAGSYHVVACFIIHMFPAFVSHGCEDRRTIFFIRLCMTQFLAVLNVDAIYDVNSDL